MRNCMLIMTNDNQYHSKDGYYCNPPIVTLNIMYNVHNVINLSVDVSHVLVLSYYLVNNKICLKYV